MSVLDRGVQKGLDAVGLGSVGRRRVQRPSFVTNDFSTGLVITEIKNGRLDNDERVVLLGEFMPHQPFEYGGEQRIVSEYYPGNSEPTVQVLGPKEGNTIIRGRLKTKKIANSDDVDLRSAALEMQELIDAMRIRGNLVLITLGDLWKRYGFIESVQFKLRTVTNIEYEIKFFIVGFNPPKNSKVLFVDETSPIGPNKAVTNAALAAFANARQFPTEMPRTLSEFLEDQINVVAGVVSTVTGFVDDVVSTAEQLQRSADRAIGLIRYARATIANTARRIGAVSTGISNLGSSFTSEAQKTVATVKNVNHLNSIRGSFFTLAALLASLQANFETIRQTVPLQRHLVRDGDTLQSLSIKYYNTPEYWERIYQHNKLRDTALVVGSILEIPRIN